MQPAGALRISGLSFRVYPFSGLFSSSSLLLSRLELSDTKVYERYIRARLGTAAHFGEGVVHSVQPYRVAARNYSIEIGYCGRGAGLDQEVVAGSRFPHIRFRIPETGSRFLGVSGIRLPTVERFGAQGSTTKLLPRATCSSSSFMRAGMNPAYLQSG